MISRFGGACVVIESPFGSDDRWLIARMAPPSRGASGHSPTMTYSKNRRASDTSAVSSKRTMQFQEEGNLQFKKQEIEGNRFSKPEKAFRRQARYTILATATVRTRSAAIAKH
eukprot:5385-Pleurochrysis_carterae.AAC.3